MDIKTCVILAEVDLSRAGEMCTKTSRRAVFFSVGPSDCDICIRFTCLMEVSLCGATCFPYCLVTNGNQLLHMDPEERPIIGA